MSFLFHFVKYFFLISFHFMSWKALFYMKTCSFLQRRFPIVLSFFFPFSHWRNAPVWKSILHLLIRYNFVCEQQKQKACKIIFPCSIKSMYSHRKNSILEKNYHFDHLLINIVYIYSNRGTSRQLVWRLKIRSSISRAQEILWFTSFGKYEQKGNYVN